MNKVFLSFVLCVSSYYTFALTCKDLEEKFSEVTKEHYDKGFVPDESRKTKDGKPMAKEICPVLIQENNNSDHVLIFLHLTDFRGSYDKDFPKITFFSQIYQSKNFLLAWGLNDLHSLYEAISAQHAEYYTYKNDITFLGRYDACQEHTLKYKSGYDDDDHEFDIENYRFKDKVHEFDKEDDRSKVTSKSCVIS